MTQPQQQEQQQGSGQNRTENGTVLPAVPVVPTEMVAYLAYRAVMHSRDQDMIASDLALKLYPLWHIQNFDDLDRSTPLWIASVVPQVKTAYLQSQRVAAVFAHDVRMATAPDADPLPMAIPHVELPDNVIPLRFDGIGIPEVAPHPEVQPLVEFGIFPAQDVSTSLAITGSYGVKSQMPGPEAELMASGLTNSAGASIRQAMNGGRNVTGNVVRSDRRIIGYARVTDSNPCWFCALLASRGAMYATKSFLNGGRKRWDGVLTKADKEFESPKGEVDLPPGFSNVAKVHDHCRCQLRPVYSKRNFRDAEAQFYYDQWDSVRRANYWLDNRKQLEIFREQYTPFERKPADVADIRGELQSRADALAQAGFHQFTPQVEWANRQLDQLA